MNYNKNISYFFLFLILFYIFLTNSYFDYESSLINGGADGFSYYEISKYAPNISATAIQPIHSERFFFPYIIGIISKILNLEIYLIYRIFVITVIILINKYFIDIFLQYNKNIFLILISLLVLNFNPYLTRYYLSIPLIINDLIFVYGSLLTLNGLKDKIRSKFYVGLIIASLARQSAAAIILSILVLKIIQKKKFFMKNLEIIFSLLIFIIIYILCYSYSSLVPPDSSRGDQYFVTIFGLFIENRKVEELLIFFIWPFLSFFPLLVYFFLFIKNNLRKFRINLSTNYYIIFFGLLIILQPIMQGLEVSGKNIIRLSTLAFPMILTYFLINSKSEKLSNLKFLLFSLMVFIWSSHPTFSIYNFLEKFKF